MATEADADADADVHRRRNPKKFIAIDSVLLIPFTSSMSVVLVAHRTGTQTLTYRLRECERESASKIESSVWVRVCGLVLDHQKQLNFAEWINESTDWLH